MTGIEARLSVESNATDTTMNSLNSRSTNAFIESASSGFFVVIARAKACRIGLAESMRIL